MPDGEQQFIPLGFETNEQLLSYNEEIAAEFRANEGACGGRFEGNPMILVNMTGARSGRQLTVPLSYCADGDDCIVMASAGGSPRHPQWYFNLAANSHVKIERGTETFDATAIITEGSDRQDAYEKITTAMPRFAGYQDVAGREIPVIRLVRN